MPSRTSLSEAARELRLALRQLLRRPGFAAVALATLALGIGAPTAIFSVVHAVLLRPLPYPESDRLVQFRIEARGPVGRISFDALPVSSALEWAATSNTLQAMSVYNDRALTLSTPDGPFRLSGIAATPNLFEILRAAPAVGRTFTSDPHDVVLGHATWQRFFHGSPDIVGTKIPLDGEQYVVMGVMAADFGFPTPEAAFWVPVMLDPGGTRGMLLPAVARLKPHASIAAVVDEGQRVLEDMGPRGDRTLVVRTMQDQMVGGVRRLLWVLMGSVGFVFVIATSNIALLLLTRGAGREREFSIRLAIGASRGRLVRQLFAEGLVLAVIGGAAGVLAATFALDAVLRLAPPDMPRLQHAELNGVVLAFAAALSLGTSLVFGVLSAGSALASDPARALGRPAGDSHAVVARASRRRLNLLAAGEIAVTMILLVGAGLLLRSFVAVVLVDQGFRDRGALALQINLPSSRYPTPAARLAFHTRLLDRLKSEPGFEAAGLTTSMPNRQPSARFDFNPDGLREFPDPMSRTVADVRTVSEGFLEAMGVPLLAGRTFRSEDVAGAEEVMVISRQLARQHFPDGHAVGRLLYSGTGIRRVIGVVGDVKPAAPGAEISPAAYLAMRQDPDVFQWFGTVTMVVRGSDPTKATSALRALVLSLDPEMPPFNIRTLSHEVATLTAAPRFAATLLAMFGGVALVLAAIGVYGVMAHSAGQRTREIGLRIALGATRVRVFGLVFREGVLVVGGGVAAGLVAAIWLARALTGLLHEVTPADPIALVSVAAILSTVALVAAWLPASRATRVSALDALRQDG